MSLEGKEGRTRKRSGTPRASRHAKACKRKKARTSAKQRLWGGIREGYHGKGDAHSSSPNERITLRRGAPRNEMTERERARKKNMGGKRRDQLCVKGGIRSSRGKEKMLIARGERRIWGREHSGGVAGGGEEGMRPTIGELERDIRRTQAEAIRLRDRLAESLENWGRPRRFQEGEGWNQSWDRESKRAELEGEIPRRSPALEGRRCGLKRDRGIKELKEFTGANRRRGRRKTLYKPEKNRKKRTSSLKNEVSRPKAAAALKKESPGRL